MAAEEIEVVTEYPVAQSIDEQRRAFVFAQLADAEIDGEVLVKNMDMIARWIETGEVPKKGQRVVKLSTSAGSPTASPSPRDGSTSRGSPSPDTIGTQC